MLYSGPLGVITLPVLAPLAALLQLLFPGLLRAQWQQYRIAISVLLTQSTLLCVQWAAVRWLVAVRSWWTSDTALTLAIIGAALIGLVWSAVATRKRLRGEGQPRGGEEAHAPPTTVEYLALGVFLLLGLAWAGYQWLGGGAVLDQMALVTAGCLAGCVHLLYRRARARSASTAQPSPVPRISTELVFLSAVFLSGMALWLLIDAPPQNASAGPVASQWTTFRGSPQRLGVAGTAAGKLDVPRVLWTFDPGQARGRVKMHSSPTVADGLVFIGALYEIQTLSQGYVYCINAEEGRRLNGKPLAAGAALWRFSAGETAKPIFSSPMLAGGRLYVGEGYHQDRYCRLFCLDAGRGELLWQRLTKSHVESSPTIENGRIYVGAGDDGLLCLSADEMQADAGGRVLPKTLWHVEHLHVDASPLAAEGRVYVGSCVGDVYGASTVQAVAIDAASGKVLWRRPSDTPFPNAPAYAQGAVLFGMANGKLDQEAVQPRGGLLCLDAATGERRWELATPGSVLCTPAVQGKRAYITCRDGTVRCVRLEDGQLAWSRDLGDPLVASPIVAGEEVYVLSTSGILACLSAATGEVRWRLEQLRAPDNDAYSSPVLSGGRLYAAIGGKLHCLGASEYRDSPPHLSVR